MAAGRWPAASLSSASSVPSVLRCLYSLRPSVLLDEWIQNHLRPIQPHPHPKHAAWYGVSAPHRPPPPPALANKADSSIYLCSTSTWVRMPPAALELPLRRLSDEQVIIISRRIRRSSTAEETLADVQAATC